MSRAATATEVQTLARGREEIARRRAAGTLPHYGRRGSRLSMPPERELGVKPSPGRNFHCPKCGETLSWPASTYVCPAGHPGWIDTRGRS